MESLTSSFDINGTSEILTSSSDKQRKELNEALYGLHNLRKKPSSEED